MTRRSYQWHIIITAFGISIRWPPKALANFAFGSSIGEGAIDVGHSGVFLLNNAIYQGNTRHNGAIRGELSVHCSVDFGWNLDGG
jgi:hypothetical protein